MPLFFAPQPISYQSIYLFFKRNCFRLISNSPFDIPNATKNDFLKLITRLQKTLSQQYHCFFRAHIKEATELYVDDGSFDELLICLGSHHITTAIENKLACIPNSYSLSLSQEAKYFLRLIDQLQKTQFLFNNFLSQLKEITAAHPIIEIIELLIFNMTNHLNYLHARSLFIINCNLTQIIIRKEYFKPVANPLFLKEIQPPLSHMSAMNFNGLFPVWELDEVLNTGSQYLS